MRNQRRGLRGAVARFANNLRKVAQQLNDGVSFLSRATQLKPYVGPVEFQAVISDVQEEVQELITKVENLERFTTDTISFEELLGHCLALYQANRSTIDNLEAHLQQYGYHRPPGLVLEPTNPLSAEAVAAATARISLGGCNRRACNSSDDGSSNDDEQEVDHRPTDVRPYMTSSFKVLATEPPAAAAAMTTRRLGPSQLQSKGRRKCTPTAKACMASPYSSLSEAEPGCFASRIAFDEESDLLPDKSAASRHQPVHQPRGRERDVGGLQQPLPTGYLTDKNHQLLSKHSASMAADAAAAASFHVSARKASKPQAFTTAASNNTLSPHQQYSPNTARILAKYNPPVKEEHVDCGPMSLAASFDLASLLDTAAAPSSTAAAAARAEALSTALRGLTPFGQRTRGEATALSSSVASQGQQLHASLTAVQPQPRPQPLVDEDTCALYQQIIRKPAPPPPEQHPPQKPTRPFVPPLNLGQRVTGTAVNSLPEPTSQRHALPPPQKPAFSGRTSPHLSPRPSMPPPDITNTPERNQPFVSTTAPASAVDSRCATPLSTLRANREQHNKLLAEKMAGLEREWIESGQAALTPMRRSMGGFGGGSANGDAAALIRANSPATYRAAATAAAATVQQQPGGLVWSERDVQEAPASVRVLSSLQPSALTSAFNNTATAPSYSSATAATAAISYRTARSSGLPGPPQPAAAMEAAATAAAALAPPATAAITTTVVGATTGATTTRVVGATTMQRREGSSTTCDQGQLTIDTKATQATATPLRTPNRTTRRPGTPGRVPRPVSSPPAAASVCTTVITTTPRAAARVTMTSAAAADVRASTRGTPMCKSYSSAPLEAAEAAAAAAIEPRGATTPGHARRSVAHGIMSSTAGSSVSPSGTPGQNRAAATASATAVATRPVLPQLQLGACRRLGGVYGGVGGDTWGGFPLSRRGVEGSGGVETRPASSRAANNRAGHIADDFILGMPPSVSSTPTATTPGGRGGPAGPAALGAMSSTVQSPSATKLMLHPMGDGFGGGALRPASRIPTPGKGSRPPTAASATAAALAAAAPSISLEPCREEEYDSIPTTIQAHFPLAVLNGHLRTLAQALAARPSCTDPKCFSAADLGLLALNASSAKRFLNLLVKLGRCQAVGGVANGGTMLYRLSS